MAPTQRGAAVRALNARWEFANAGEKVDRPPRHSAHITAIAAAIS
jgi:hypothetical protein